MVVIPTDHTSDELPRNGLGLCKILLFFCDLVPITMSANILPAKDVKTELS